MTECTGADPLPNGIAHPIALFHVPFLGAKTSIGEMFALGQAESDSSIGIESYVWEFHEPLREEVEYRVDGDEIPAWDMPSVSERLARMEPQRNDQAG